MAITKRGKEAWARLQNGFYKAHLAKSLAEYKQTLKSLEPLVVKQACAAAIAELQQNGLSQFWTGDVEPKYRRQMEQYRGNLETFSDALYNRVQQDKLSAEHFLQLGAAGYLALFGARDVPNGEVRGGKDQQKLLEGLYNVMQKELTNVAPLPDLSESFSNTGSCAAADIDDVQEVSSENRNIRDYLGQELLLVNTPKPNTRAYLGLLVLTKARINNKSQTNNDLATKIQLQYISSELITAATVELSSAEVNSILKPYQAGKRVEMTHEEFWWAVAAKQINKDYASAAERIKLANVPLNDATGANASATQSVPLHKSLRGQDVILEIIHTSTVETYGIDGMQQTDPQGRVRYRVAATFKNILGLTPALRAILWPKDDNTFEIITTMEDIQPNSLIAGSTMLQAALENDVEISEAEWSAKRTAAGKVVVTVKDQLVYSQRRRGGGGIGAMAGAGWGTDAAAAYGGGMNFFAAQAAAQRAALAAIAPMLQPQTLAAAQADLGVAGGSMQPTGGSVRSIGGFNPAAAAAAAGSCVGTDPQRAGGYGGGGMGFAAAMAAARAGGMAAIAPLLQANPVTRHPAAADASRKRTLSAPVEHQPRKRQ